VTRKEDQPKAALSETSAPVRNFTMTLADRVRAAAGPPAYMRRLREIEDIEARLLREVLHGADPAQLDLRRINDLIERHNRYYPCEANLPMDPRSGRLVERGGRAWMPLAPFTPARLAELAREHAPARDDSKGAS